MIEPARHVVLVGMMGSGKTTVAKRLSRRLGRPLVDTDAAVEARAGKSVRAVFAEDGEAQFRALESAVLRDALVSPTPAVIAAAGGVVIAPENRAALRRSGARVVWLSAPVEVLAKRVRHGGHRPLLDADPQATLQQMAAERAEWYREVADLVVAVDQRSIAEIVEAVLR